MLIDTPNQGYARTYLRVDLKNKEVCLVKGRPEKETFCGRVEEGNRFQAPLGGAWHEEMKRFISFPAAGILYNVPSLWEGSDCDMV
ncbi:MAG: hypothetical protein IPJ00_22650 [Saprospirales bacterium]|nr:hypothetical protein [Saprospirales bacterium]